jgi:L-amino acid N-acyltransferase YncA
MQLHRQVSVYSKPTIHPMPSAIIIRTLTPEDYSVIKEIYELGIQSGNATFETKAPAWNEWDRSHLATCRFFAIDENGNGTGWAALTPVSGRCVYSGVAEVSVYVHPGFQGKGIGKKLLLELIAESEKQNIWTLQAGIFPENTASLKIHEQCGFRQVGYHEKIGKMKNVWRDTALLERRSKVVGTN